MHCPTPNENISDRMIRAVLAELLFIIGLLWLSFGWRYLAYTVSIILLWTALSGFCGLYRIFGWDTRRLKLKPEPRTIFTVGGLVILGIALAAVYFSA